MVSAFWCGYFESLGSAEIEKINIVEKGMKFVP